ncbi:phosphoribosyl-ATP diphosphatase [Pacificimonas flava]|uniref:Phosphoribosyl-ATP pyrophosphatase n=2 Tax=Pacificimonas TaxID=1960290 RepID=A0A219B3C9_9SPHN|nr:MULTISPECIES: phosphoribosyl-ATP diphosphatase [Pacificimonas]MBZ6377684.1 phosphoribosyl-ATP diphosphatase [Pacificimonas aurantium]OWV32636.1 phosphoribosyl-ATP diphosphatase [Pacificimonas flava]
MTDILGRLATIVASRADAAAGESHTAALLQKGRGKIAQKVGEEAVETVIAAVAEDRAALIGESADLLYHLSVLWFDAGLTPGDIDAELARREGMSGIEEKRSRED